MKLQEALSKLDEPEVGEDYGKKTIKSSILNKWLIKSKYGICLCTNDWPVPYNLQENDYVTDDWVID